ncbi:MAG: gliding motility-associated C-terminal domain-containing protein [Sphingobacteriales bacterium]|nr:MAG: gliding motility-associated C-terminal domain-containing protein [Sphingobacteriales bacterium]
MFLKKILLYGLLLLCCFLAGNQAIASHIIGGEVRYEHISGTTYRVVLNLYGDCNLDPNSAYSRLPTMIPVITIFRDSVLPYRAIQLGRTSMPPQDASPSCPSYQTQTTCNSTSSTVPGIKRYEYAATITLPQDTTSSCWRFVFDGSESTNSAGRTTSIKNIDQNNAVTLIYIYSTLNNRSGIVNTSPDFSVLATPYFCNAPNQQFNPGATDVNGDVLTNRLTVARGTGNAPVGYVNGYPAPYYLATTGTPVFNPQTGQLTFSPSQTQYSTVVYQIDEYRRGIRVGSIMREMNFVVIPCTNSAPSANPTGMTNAVLLNNTTISVCRGQTASFSLNPTDPQNDTIDITASGIPATASFVISGNGTPAPTSTFSWNTANVPPATYNFFVSYADRSCPISSRQVIGYSVVVADPVRILYTAVRAATCSTQNVFRIDVPSGTSQNITILQNGVVIRSYANLTSAVTDSLPAGRYVIRAASGASCTGDTTIVLAAPEGYTIQAGPDQSICQGDSVQLMATSTTDNWQWSPATGLSCTSCIDPIATPQSSQRYVVRTVFPDGCRAEDSVLVQVIGPVATRISADTTICAGDTVQLFASGGAQYQWTPAGSLLNPTTQNPRAFPGVSTRYTVVIRENKCFSDTLSQLVTVVPRATVQIDEDFSAMSGTSVTLRAVVTNANAILWSPATGLSCTDCPNPTAQLTTSIVYIATAQNSYGCSGKDSVRITATCDGSAYYVANTFTPNGDGQDDWFYPQGKAVNPISRMDIYNRWGQKVFEGRNLTPNDPYAGWNGRYQGKALGAGVFLYVMETFCADGTPVYLKGDINLVR